MNRFFLMAFFSALLVMGAPSALAADEVAKGERKAETSENPPVIAAPDIEKYQDKTEEVYAQLKEIADGLTGPEEKHFGMIYNNYNLIGTVKMVQEDVGKAIDACSDANPDMENALRGRYQQWKDMVDPVVEDAEAHLGNMVSAQDYTAPKKIKSLFKAVDQTRKFTNTQVKKTPVTTKKACEYLLDKMGETDKNLTRLLKETLMSVPPEVEGTPQEEAPAADE
ncbi:MAG: hypothetical protein ACT4OY_07740 [Alphaproteobacteria bacterium]